MCTRKSEIHLLLKKKGRRVRNFQPSTKVLTQSFKSIAAKKGAKCFHFSKVPHKTSERITSLQVTLLFSVCPTWFLSSQALYLYTNFQVSSHFLESLKLLNRNVLQYQDSPFCFGLKIHSLCMHISHSIAKKSRKNSPFCSRSKESPEPHFSRKPIYN